jgi:phosphate starvation-inducible protein PhoH
LRRRIFMTRYQDVRKRSVSKTMKKEIRSVVSDTLIIRPSNEVQNAYIKQINKYIAYIGNWSQIHTIQKTVRCGS